MVAAETSFVTKTIAKGSAAVADLAIATIGGTLVAQGVQISLLDEDEDNYTIGITLLHDATSTQELEYSHAEIEVVRGAAVDKDNVMDTIGGVVKGSVALHVGYVPSTDTDTYLVVLVHLAA